MGLAESSSIRIVDAPGPSARRPVDREEAVNERDAGSAEAVPGQAAFEVGAPARFEHDLRGIGCSRA
jgi:hypothetical protein